MMRVGGGQFSFCEMYMLIWWVTSKFITSSFFKENFLGDWYDARRRGSIFLL